MMISGASLQQEAIHPPEPGLLMIMFGASEQQLSTQMVGGEPLQQESVHPPLERNAEVTGVEQLMLQQESMHCIGAIPGKAALTFIVGR